MNPKVPMRHSERGTLVRRPAIWAACDRLEDFDRRHGAVLTTLLSFATAGLLWWSNLREGPTNALLLLGGVFSAFSLLSFTFTITLARVFKITARRSHLFDGSSHILSKSSSVAAYDRHGESIDLASQDLQFARKATFPLRAFTMLLSGEMREDATHSCSDLERDLLELRSRNVHAFWVGSLTTWAMIREIGIVLFKLLRALLTIWLPSGKAK